MNLAVLVFPKIPAFWGGSWEFESFLGRSEFSTFHDNGKIWCGDPIPILSRSYALTCSWTFLIHSTRFSSLLSTVDLTLQQRSTLRTIFLCHCSNRVSVCQYQGWRRSCSWCGIWHCVSCKRLTWIMKMWTICCFIVGWASVSYYLICRYNKRARRCASKGYIISSLRACCRMIFIVLCEQCCSVFVVPPSAAAAAAVFSKLKKLLNSYNIWQSKK